MNKHMKKPRNEEMYKAILTLNTVEELVQRDEDEMMKVRNLGRKSLEEVQQKLSALGLSLRTNED